ncbi:holo-ACP synthase [Candidatus Poriferisodalis sp.]|uniref:holo-ACP synthase n=1 Tax=Candidatus Poriferisodalis sp. TaxID=3101277 RepID=UPI003AF97C76
MIWINRRTLSEAWIDTFGAVLDAGGSAVNAITRWNADDEIPAVGNVLDDFITSRPESSKPWPRWPVETVANTIFAAELYEEELGIRALEEFSDLYLEGFEIARRASPSGEYCHRMVAWPSPDGAPFNQLVEVASKLRRYADPDHSYHYSSDYEIALEDPVLGLRTQLPGSNRDPYGFPCLSHISLTVQEGTVHITALYRNQHLIKKAYGNYLGLARLGRALCHHSGLEFGTVTVVATHADAEVHAAKGFGLNELRKLRHHAVAALPTFSPCRRTLTASRLAAATAAAAGRTIDPTATAVGVDAVSIADFEADVLGDRFVLETIFAESELADCDDDYERLAARFAAKEAVLKAIGTGIRGLDMLDVVIHTADDGQPTTRLSEAAADLAARSGLCNFECSLTHEEGFAIAVATASRSAGRDARLDAATAATGMST